MYLLPILSIYYFKRYSFPQLRQIMGWRITLAIYCLPILMVLISSLSVLIYDFNLLPLILFISTIVLLMVLYQQAKNPKTGPFRFKRFYLPASKILFTLFFFFVLSLILLRFYTYFR